MQLNALWTIEYATNHGDFGTGVAVLADGRIYGGDSHYCYEGTYERQGDEIVARVKLCLHSRQRILSGETDDEVCVLMRGRPAAEELELTGVLEHEPNTKLFIHMQRRPAAPVTQGADVQWPLAGQADTSGVSRMAGDDESAYLIGESTERLPLY